MKKIFTMLGLLLCAVVGANAQTTIGLMQKIDGTSMAAATYSNGKVEQLTVTEAHGAGCGINQATKGTGEDDTSITAEKTFRKTVKSSDWDATEWVGYTIEVASGYKVSLTNVHATLWDASSNCTFTWRVMIENPSGTALYTSDTKTSKKGEVGIVEDANPDNLANLPAGKYTVKLQMYQNGGNKYFTIPYLTVDALVETDNTPMHTITTSASPAEGGSVLPETGSQAEGSDVILTATANEGYKFVKWTVDGTDYTTNPYTITAITADHTAQATFEALPKITFDKGEGTGTAPSTAYIEKGASYALPTPYFIFKSGATFTGWNDGAKTYAPGESYTIQADVTFTAVYTDNTVALGITETTVNWDFATKNGAPVINCEGSETDYVQHVNIGGTPLDVVMHINTKQDAGIEGKKGKVNNTSGDNRAQVNAGSVFTIPAVNGMIVTVTATSTSNASVSSIKFDGKDADSYADGVLTYTYTGTASTIDLIDQGNSLYPSGITVTYPSTTNWAKPSIAVGDFSFENKGYQVTITGDGTLMVDEGDGTFAAKTSPYVTYATTTTTFKAKSTGEGKEDSEVAEQSVANTFDANKKFVAWVYTKGYGAKEYAFDTDPMVKALLADYNVVEVNSAADAEPAEDLKNADLIVCTEAMSGNKKLSNGMKAFAGVTPMISLKAFNYTKGRWSWGTPKNPDSAPTKAFAPKSAYLKVLNGVTAEADGTITLATATEGNVIQTVEFGTADCTAPEGNIILGTLGGDDAQAVMYASAKYFGLGLSSDCWATYTDNAVTIIKNAAAMLIAGEALDTKVFNVTEAGYATIVTDEATDFAAMGIKAYKAQVNATKDAVELTAVTVAPAATPLVIEATKGSYEVKAAAAAEAIADNDLVAGSVTGDGAAHYVLGQKDSKVGFGLLAADVVLPATKAYIPAAKFAAAAPFFEIIFSESETTGINAAKTAKQIDGAAYNLAGQRVAQPQKGLYIVNGKKVVMK